jgi:Right handed beta helix region
MPSFKSLGAAIAVASALLAISAPAHAQSRSWVSGVGDDANPCSRTAPCRTFAAAVSKTVTNGIINCIDNAGYGSVTITRSMTIDCHENLASVLVIDLAGITVNIPAGDPKDPQRTARFRNIDISGSGGGGQGINIISAAAVIVEDVTITQVAKQGINDIRADGGMLSVKNTTIANNAGVGIVAAAGPTSSVVLDNVHSFKNTFGLAIAKNNSVMANRSVFSGNSSSGIQADSGALLVLDNSVVSANAVGLSASGGPVAFGNTDITFNGTGITGTTTSFGNNRIFANTVAGIVPTPAGAAAPALGQQ